MGFGWGSPRRTSSSLPRIINHLRCSMPAVVDEYLAHEVSLGRVAGPFTPPPPPQPPSPNLQVSSFGVIPKAGAAGKVALDCEPFFPWGG